eukprot:COSAG02_NODE_43273_length_376_cov_0.924188_1_plen_39_part_10
MDVQKGEGSSRPWERFFKPKKELGAPMRALRLFGLRAVL